MQDSSPPYGQHGNYIKAQCTNSHCNLDRTHVVINIMSFAGKPLVKIAFGPLQSYFLAENIPTMPNFE